VTEEYVQVFRVRAAKVIELREYRDTAEAFNAVGLKE
jgi:hypothetical protein